MMKLLKVKCARWQMQGFVLLLCAAAMMTVATQTQSKVSGIYEIDKDGLLKQYKDNSTASVPTHSWGRLANLGYQNQAIKTTLFFAGRPLDGTGSANPSDPFFNGAGPSAIAQGCYSVHTLDKRNLNWVDADNPPSDANRQYVLQSMVTAGLNVVSMSTWGESSLPSTADCTSYVKEQDCGAPCSETNRDNCCSDPDASKCIPRCSKRFGSKRFGGTRSCRIGWFGAAPMQTSTLAKDQLFSAAVEKPLLILPFIESRFDVDWDFDDEFPTSTDGRTAPLLISQIEDLISHNLKNRAHPEWAGKWARVYDQNGTERYAVVVAHAASQRLDPSDRDSDRQFAAGFDAVANKIFEDTGGDRNGGVRIGFFLDVIPRSPTSSFGCPGIDPSKLTSLYGTDRVFKPDAVSSGPYLRQQASILGIHSYMPEGWVEVKPEAGSKVNECFRIAWKEDFSRQWFKTGIPFLQDVSPGYDGSLLFQNRLPRDWGLTKWGYDPTWFAKMNQLVRDYGENGMVFNAWNGYCEGLAGMETVEYGVSTANLPRALTSIHPQPKSLGPVRKPPIPVILDRVRATLQDAIRKKGIVLGKPDSNPPIAPAPKGPAITAETNPVMVPQGQDSGTTTITWKAAPDYTYSEIYLSVDNGEWSEFARGGDSSKSTTIKLGSIYTFRMMVYEGQEGTPKIITTLTVTAKN